MSFGVETSRCREIYEELCQARRDRDNFEDRVRELETSLNATKNRVETLSEIGGELNRLLGERSRELSEAREEIRKLKEYAPRSYQYVLALPRSRGGRKLYFGDFCHKGMIITGSKDRAKRFDTREQAAQFGRIHQLLGGCIVYSVEKNS